MKRGKPTRRKVEPSGKRKIQGITQVIPKSMEGCKNTSKIPRYLELLTTTLN